ncbi:beta-hexosaminidase subunit beta-like isoform X2 [Gigantopelta aegis]|uniref:beta-hexosaminidase subunit beta-like isoform X2 n=1 Tax=Gigantopelta aegis TaxID=1735272 RepID=UPI001B88E691|nr:beta-hexosaminidase subunit beta-like isoform X2 [Gigantopelta aegis]
MDVTGCLLYVCLRVLRATHLLLPAVYSSGRCNTVFKCLLPLLIYSLTTSTTAADTHNHVHQGHVDHEHPHVHHNPVFEFAQGRRRQQPPASPATSSDELTNMYNRLKAFHQGVHPRTDTKSGGLRINWSKDMFFLLFGRQMYAEPFGVRRSPHPSTGSPWPLPKRYARNDKMIYRIDEDHFEIRTDSAGCDVMEEAVVRYTKRIVLNSLEDLYDNLQNAEATTLNDPRGKYSTDLYVNAPVISALNVYIKKPCKDVTYPSITSDESYHIIIKSNQTVLEANEVWGALRGLETFSQLVWKGTDQKLYVMETIVIDKPRFPHRGIMIDTARHYIFKEVLFDVMDGMEMNKMNVLHWHIVDDQSFPFQSKTFPELSKKGAYHATYVYSHEDIGYIIEYGRLRGIRVIPEFDVPGHTYAWGLSQPGLLSHCSNPVMPQPGYMGPMDASKDETYTFLKSFFKEVLSVFKDQFIHIGGDEVPVECWNSNPTIMKEGEKLYRKWKGDKQSTSSNMMDQNVIRVQQSGYNSNNMMQARPMTNQMPFGSHQLWDYFQNRFMGDLDGMKKDRPAGLKYMMWQEAAMKTDIKKFVNDTVVIIWLGNAQLLREAIYKGYKVLYTSCWYLDNISPGPDWQKYYKCDPAFPGQGVDETKVLGGEACLWAEYITNENLMVLLWPRASAAAERLWSTRDTQNIEEAAPRLHEQRCRMLSRGLAVNHANGPDYCLRDGRVKGARPRDNLGRVITVTHRVNTPLMSVFQEMIIIIQVIIILILLLVVCRNKSYTDHVLKTFRLRGSRKILIVFISICGLCSIFYMRMWSFQFSNP